MGPAHTRVMRSALRATIGLAVGGVLLLLAAPVAAQTDPPNATGPCEARVELSTGVVIDPYVSSGVHEVPVSGTADYSGGVTAPVPVPRAISGEVYIEGPLGFRISVADDWSWSNDSSNSLAAEGTVDWDLPRWLPRGAELVVVGVHDDAGFTCRGSVTVQLEGGFFDSPLGAISLFGTALSGLGLVGALFAKTGGA